MTGSMVLLKLDREFDGDAPGTEVVLPGVIGRELEAAEIGRIVGGEIEARQCLRRRPGSGIGPSLPGAA